MIAPQFLDDHDIQRDIEFLDALGAAAQLAQAHPRIVQRLLELRNRKVQQQGAEWETKRVIP